MRTGETDKAVSIHEGEYYISEVNPRFGCSFPHGYVAGVNIPKQLIKKLQGTANKPELKNYEAGLYILKYNESIYQKRFASYYSVETEEEGMIMNILITGADGFVGKNLAATLKQFYGYTIFSHTHDSTKEDLDKFAKNAHFVFHLAGMDRTENVEEFKRENVTFTENLLNKLVEHKNKSSILSPISVQTETNKTFEENRTITEDLIFNYGKKQGVKTYIFRLPEIFGKWSRPKYNSIVAYYCYKIARDEDIIAEDPSKKLTLVYIDDVIQEFLNVLVDEGTKVKGYYKIPTVYEESTRKIIELIKYFKEMRKTKYIPNLNDSFTKKLYSTYVSFLRVDDFSYPAPLRQDKRGVIKDLMKSSYLGQVSVDISHPGVTRGNHWHHTKTKKLMIIFGEGLIRFRKPLSEKIFEYRVSEKQSETIDIPPGYVYSVTNTGSTDLVIIVWVNGEFDPDHSDTYHLKV